MEGREESNKRQEGNVKLTPTSFTEVRLKEMKPSNKGREPEQMTGRQQQLRLDYWKEERKVTRDRKER